MGFKVSRRKSHEKANDKFLQSYTTIILVKDGVEQVMCSLCNLEGSFVKKNLPGLRGQYSQQPR